MLSPPLYHIVPKISFPLYPWHVALAIVGIERPDLGGPQTRPVSSFAGISKVFNPDTADTEEKKEMLKKLQKMTGLLPETITPLIEREYDPMVSVAAEITYHMPTLPGKMYRKTTRKGRMLDLVPEYRPYYGFQMREISEHRGDKTCVSAGGRKDAKMTFVDLRPVADFAMTWTFHGKTRLSHVLSPDTGWNLTMNRVTWHTEDVKIRSRTPYGWKIPALNNIHGDGRLCTGPMSPALEYIRRMKGNMIPAMTMWLEAWTNQTPNLDLNRGIMDHVYDNLLYNPDGTTAMTDPKLVARCIEANWPGTQPPSLSNDFFPPSIIDSVELERQAS